MEVTFDRWILTVDYVSYLSRSSLERERESVRYRIVRYVDTLSSTIVRYVGTYGTYPLYILPTLRYRTFFVSKSSQRTFLRG
jgi:hypothetical protein